MNKKCILIGAGDFYESNLLIGEEDCVIAVDGGYSYAKKLGIRVDLFVGDFDSYPEEKMHLPILKSMPEKDDTDMLLALYKGIEMGFEQFVLYGAMGGRVEHTLANIQCLKYLCEHKKHGVMISQKQRIEVINRSKQYPSSLKGYISVFSLTDRAVVSLKNLKYELAFHPLTSSYPLGVDNEFIGKESTVEVHEGVVCIIISEE